MSVVGLKEDWAPSHAINKTMIQFKGIIPELGCPAVAFIEDEVQFFYTFTSTEELQRFFEPIVTDIGFIRVQIAKIVRTIHPISRKRWLRIRVSRAESEQAR